MEAFYKGDGSRPPNLLKILVFFKEGRFEMKQQGRFKVSEDASVDCNFFTYIFKKKKKNQNIH